MPVTAGPSDSASGSPKHRIPARIGNADLGGNTDPAHNTGSELLLRRVA